MTGSVDIGDSDPLPDTGEMAVVLTPTTLPSRMAPSFALAAITPAPGCSAYAGTFPYAYAYAMCGSCAPAAAAAAGFVNAILPEAAAVCDGVADRRAAARCCAMAAVAVRPGCMAGYTCVGTAAAKCCCRWG